MSLSAIEEPEVLDITVVVGNSFNREIELCDDAGAPVDLTGKTACAQIYDVEDDRLLAEFTIPALGSDGKIPLILRVSESLKLDCVSSASWSLTVFDTDNPEADTTTILYGKVNVRKVGLEYK
jgi:hypothetical protein